MRFLACAIGLSLLGCGDGGGAGEDVGTGTDGDAGDPGDGDGDGDGDRDGDGDGDGGDGDGDGDGDGAGVDLTACRTWAEGDDDLDDGATRDFYNRAAGLAWRNYLGDWLDADGAAQGTNPYATASLTDDDVPETAAFDVSALVVRWVDGEAPNRGFLLRTTSGAGPFDFASREAADAGGRPRLVLQTAQGERTLEPSADTSLRDSTFQSNGQSDTLRVVGMEPALVRFDLSGLAAGEVTSASLELTSVSEYGGGSFEVGVFEAAPGPLTDPPAPEAGLASQYPGDVGIGGDAAVYAFTDFETDGWGDAWTSGAGASTLAVVDDEPGFEALSGRALKVTVPQGGNLGMSLSYAFMDEAGEEPEAVYMRYYLRFADSWRPADGGKLPGVAGTYGVAGWGGRPVDGTDGWSARGVYRASPPAGNPFEGHVPIGNYVYHADMQGQYGDDELYVDHCGGVLAKNRWYAVEQYIQLNTPGNNDGILRAWVDGRLVEEKTDWRWRDVTSLRIEEIWMNVYHGGTATAPEDLVLYVDDIVIASDYVGPMQ